MIHKDTKISEDLKANNSKEWLDKHKNWYEFTKTNILNVA